MSQEVWGLKDITLQGNIKNQERNILNFEIVFLLKNPRIEKKQFKL